MNLSSNINFDLKSFFLWWGEGLSSWLPESLRVLLSDRLDHIVLSVDDESLQLNRIEADNNKILAKIPLSNQGAIQYQQIIASDTKVAKAHLTLRLKSSQAIKKVVMLPVAAKENLRQVIAFEMDKITPFHEDQVYFSVQPLGKEQDGFIKVLLVVTPKQVLDATLQQLKHINVYPNSVDYEGAANSLANDSEPYNLLPESERPVKGKMGQITFWISSFILLMLTIVTLVYPVWQMSEDVDLLRGELRQIEKGSRVVQTLQLQTDNIIDETLTLIQSKNDSPSLTGLINTLSQLIPVDTWLTHFKYNKDRLQIQGQSPSASALISILEGSPLLSNARFVSPLTQDKKTGFERFQISVEVISQGAKADE